MKEKTLAILLIWFVFSSLHGQVNFFISPDGNDKNSGTIEKPFATLEGARNAIRSNKIENPLSASIVVIIANGVYPMKKPFILEHEDSGTEAYPIVYKAAKGASPVFSGGVKISRFKVNNNGIWEVELPKRNKQFWHFDQLYVNGKRAILARTPNEGFLKIKNIQQNILIKGTGRAPEKAQQILSFDKKYFSLLENMNKTEIKNVRFRAFHNWDFTLRFIDEIDKDKLQISTIGQGMKPWNPIKKGGRILFENFEAALDTAGEWYLNNQGKLFYIPLPGETPENTEVIVPVLENIMDLQGNPLSNSFVEHIRFEGIAFQHCHYRYPNTGSEPNQAAVLINAAIMLNDARNITFSNCEISKTGQHALWFKKGCSNATVEHCYLNDLGGGGIYLGDTNASDEKEHTKKINLKNNIIQSGGKEFPSAVGIWIGHSSDNHISHNDIGNFYYTGISVGWIWGYGDSSAKRNSITYNNIHHIGWDLLSDMAAVYTLGKSEGTVISNNVIHHIHAYSYGGWGLYTDEGSSDITMENNLVYSTKTGGFHQHYGKNNTLKNNIFAFAKLYQIQCTRVEEHRSFNFENNIVVFDNGVVLKGPWNKIDIQMDNNLYWSYQGNTNNSGFNDSSFTNWQKSGHDSQSIIADPHFKNAMNFDFDLKDMKNTSRIQFQPFDFLKAGVYGDQIWKEKAKLSKSILEKFDKVVNENMNLEEIKH